MVSFFDVLRPILKQVPMPEPPFTKLEISSGSALPEMLGNPMLKQAAIKSFETFFNGSIPVFL